MRASDRQKPNAVGNFILDQKNERRPKFAEIPGFPGFCSMVLRMFFTSLFQSHLTTLVKQMGGTVSKAYTTKVTQLVADSQDTESKKYVVSSLQFSELSKFWKILNIFKIFKSFFR